MRKRDKTCAKATPEEPKREQRMVCLMSEEELRIVDRYLEKYKITNKSRWLRETILMFIHKNMEEDYPTLHCSVSMTCEDEKWWNRIDV